MEDKLISNIKDSNDLKQRVKKMKEENYNKILNDEKMKKIVFTHVEIHSILEKNIREQKEILENLEKQKIESEKVIYLATNLTIAELKEYSKVINV